MTRPRKALLPALALAAIAAAPAPAGAHVESMFQADRELTQQGPAVAAATLDRLAALGVERIRIAVLWRKVAPSPDTTRPPAGFDAHDPASYGAAWEPYDTAIRLAAERGIGVNVVLTLPGPRWATGRAPASWMRGTWAPSAAAFGDFVRAAGRHWSGSVAGVPRVGYWSLLNEPNLPQWLAPQSRAGVPAAPAAYRRIADAAYAALRASGHGGDTILAADLAPKGSAFASATLGIAPLAFIRSLWCLDARERPLRGAAARAQGCPSRPSAAAFRRAHPVLFALTGWAQHPYSQQAPPSRRSSAGRAPDRDFATLADLGALERTLDRAQRAWGSSRRLPIYLTEYGYQTRPPDPYVFATPAQQAVFLNEAEYMAWRARGRVRTLSQYLLTDDPPIPGASPRDRWGSFQSGLLFGDGRPKPAYAAYRLPIWLPATGVRRGSPLFVWGLARDASGAAQATVEFRPAGGGAWTPIGTARGGDRAITAWVRPSRSGELRLVRVGVASRAVAVRVR